MSILDLAARYRYEFLYSKYQTGNDVIRRFNNEPPFGWIISDRQSDPHTMALLLNNFMDYGIDVYQSDEAFVHEGIAYPGGSFIIPTAQAFGFYAKTILEKQEYPDIRKYPYLWQGVGRQIKWDGAPIAPYDGVGWTLPVQFGVDVHKMSTPLTVHKTLVTEPVKTLGEITGSGSYYVLSPEENYSYTAITRVLKEGGQVNRALEAFSIGNKHFPKGALVVKSGSISKNKLKNIALETKVNMLGGKVNVKLEPLATPRIALYKSWVANMDAGWISYIFDRYEIPYHMLTDAEARAGNLKDRFDVVILPDQRAASIINGHRKGTMPQAYVGGITMDGVDNLKVFVEQGGVLFCNRSSAALAIEYFKLPVKNVLKGVKPDSFNCPGSLLKVIFDSSHPLSYGLPERSMAYFSHGSAFEIISDTAGIKQDKKNNPAQQANVSSEKADRSPRIVAGYPDDLLLISGWLIGEELIRKKAAILDVPYGKGRIILSGFNVHNRAQSYLNFKLLFNAVYF